jgi:hypothetical protein
MCLWCLSASKFPQFKVVEALCVGIECGTERQSARAYGRCQWQCRSITFGASGPRRTYITVTLHAEVDNCIPRNSNTAFLLATLWRLLRLVFTTSMVWFGWIALMTPDSFLQPEDIQFLHARDITFKLLRKSTSCFGYNPHRFFDASYSVTRVEAKTEEVLTQNCKSQTLEKGWTVSCRRYRRIIRMPSPTQFSTLPNQWITGTRIVPLWICLGMGF